MAASLLALIRGGRHRYPGPRSLKLYTGPLRRIRAGDGMADTCRCHLPLCPPDGPHWWPSRDPEPGPDVLAVARAGCDPGFLRYLRVPDGWRTQGAAASYGGCTPWARVGRCWAGAEHPVVDVTAALPLQRHRAGGTWRSDGEVPGGQSRGTDGRSA